MKTQRIAAFLFLFTAHLSGQAQDPFVPVFPDYSSGDLPGTNPEGDQAKTHYNVDLYHGTASVRIPVFDYELDGLDLGINLSYSCNGIQVDRLASTAGLGWSLHAGPVIERMTEGIEDEYGLDILWRFDPPSGNNAWMIPAIRGFNAEAGPGNKELSRDLYKLSLPGRNLTAAFFKRADGNPPRIVSYPKSELKLQPFISSKGPTGIRRSDTSLNYHPIGKDDSIHYHRYNITDEKNNVFKFERGDYEHKMYAFREAPYAQFMIDSFYYYPVQSWRIEEVRTITGARVRYHYDRIESVNYPLYKDEKIAESENHIYTVKNRVEYWRGSISLISKVEYPDGTTVHFNYEEVSGIERRDAGGLPALKSVVIRKGYDDDVENSITYRFNYSYFHAPNDKYNHTTTEVPYDLNFTAIKSQVDPADKMNNTQAEEHMKLALRLKLNSIDRIGEDNGEERYYSFSYNTTPLPLRLSPSQDFYGYYNGKRPVPLVAMYGAGLEVKPLILPEPSIPFHTVNLKLNSKLKGYTYGVDKSTDLTHKQAGVLTGMTNGYGGRVNFFYKEHDTQYDNGIFVSGTYYNSPTVPDRPPAQGEGVNDGLCISHISYHDGYHNSNSYTKYYCFSEGQRFYNGGYMWYNGTEEMMVPVQYGPRPRLKYKFWHNRPVSKQIYHEGYNHGYSKAEVVVRSFSNEEIGRTQYTFSNLWGPYGDTRRTGAAKNLLIVFLDNHKFQRQLYAPHYMNLHNLGLLLNMRELNPASGKVKSTVSNVYKEYKLKSAFDNQVSNFQANYSESRERMFVYTALHSYSMNLVQSEDNRHGAAVRKSVTSYEYDSCDNVIRAQWRDSRRAHFTKDYYYSYFDHTDPNPPYKGLFPVEAQFLTLTETRRGPLGNSALVERNETWNRDLPGLNKYTRFLSLKATGPVVPPNTPLITEDMRYTACDGKGNITEIRHDGLERYTSSIWDGRIGKKVAEVKNARFSEIAYTGFEGPVKAWGVADDNKGNWDYDPDDIRHRSASANPPVTGNYLLYIPPHSTSKVVNTKPLAEGKKYVLSFWANIKPKVEMVPDGAGAYLDVEPEIMFSKGNNWYLYRAEIEPGANLRFLRIMNDNAYTALHLDELRLHPVDAQMSTSAYEPLWGPNTECDAHHNISYYEYDPFGRQTLVRDRDGNIISKTEEVVQGLDN